MVKTLHSEKFTYNYKTFDIKINEEIINDVYSIFHIQGYLNNNPISQKYSVTNISNKTHYDKFGESCIDSITKIIKRNIKEDFG